jgi:hypothetical protein
VRCEKQMHLCGISRFDFRNNICTFVVILLRKWSREPFWLFLVIHESTFWIDRILLEVNRATFVKSDFLISDGFRVQDS